MTFIFVGGSQRTGTSIAQQTLCQHPDVNPYVYEASFLRQLVACYVEARNNFSRNHESYFETIQNLRDFNSGVVHAFLEQIQMRLGNVKHLILKEPHLTMYWPFLFELVPQSKFLLMVRDPRDVIASMIRVGEKQKAQGDTYLFVERNIPQLCQHFNSFYQPSFSFPNEDFRQKLGIVQYEDLVLQPRSTLQQITQFTGVDFTSVDTEATPEDGHVKTEETSTDQSYSASVTEVSGKKLSNSRVGNYRQVLSLQEIMVIERECGDFFEHFGYQSHAA